MPFKDIEKQREYARKWRENNRDKTREAQKKCKQTRTPEQKAAYAAQRRLRNSTPEFKAKRAEKRKAYADKELAYSKAYNSSLAGIFSYSKENAKRRSIPFNLTRDEFEQLVAESGMRCSLSGMPLSTELNDSCKLSIDRIDSDGCYELGNVQVVAAWVNIAKCDLKQDDFIAKCKALTDFQRDKR